jgi:hypothetical protein
VFFLRTQREPDLSALFTESLEFQAGTFTSFAQTRAIEIGQTGRSSVKGASMNKNFKIAIAAIALASAPVAIGVVNAQTAPAATAATKPASKYASVFLDKLASALGVSADKLTTGLKTASNATIDEALKNQDITKVQADRLKQEVTNGQYGFFGHGLGGGRGMGGPGGDRGMGGVNDRGPGGGQVVFDAAAKALGLTSADLETQLRSGQTLDQIAKTKNVDIKTVQAAMLTALKTQLDQDVKDGRITQAQADERYNSAKADPNFGLRGPKGGQRR